MIFSNNSTYPIGLDISDLSLKLIQLNKIRDKIIVQAIGKIDLPPGIIQSGEIKNEIELIKSIKLLFSNLKYGKISTEEIIASLPESKTFIKLIEIANSPNPLSEIIESEIEKYIPMYIDEIYYDWQIIETLPDKYSVLIGAAPKNIVNQYTKMLDQAKLSPLVLEIEPIAICRCLLNEEGIFQTFTSSTRKNDTFNSKNISNTCAIIDIGASHTSMIFYSKNSILFTVSMPISGEKITENIAQTLEIEKEQADKAKIICGFDENKAQGVIKKILEEMTENLIKKINEAIGFYNNHFIGHGPLNKILVCGGGANIKEITKIIKEGTSIEVELANPLLKLSETKEKFLNILNEKHSLNINSINKNQLNDKILSVTQDSSLTYVTAIGLALRGILIDEL